MSEQRDIRLVCFDWGGVILRICRTWAQGCAAAGVPLREGFDGPEYAAARRATSDRYQRGLIGCDEFARALSRASGGLYSPEEVVRVHDAWMIEEYPGVDAVAARLAEVADVETGVLSNTNHGHWQRHLPRADGQPAEFPTIGRLQHRHASHLLGAAKPGEEIYRLFEERTGARGAEILFFDDLAENVDTARKVGWKAEQIDPSGETAGQIEMWLRRHGVFA